MSATALCVPRTARRASRLAASSLLIVGLGLTVAPQSATAGTPPTAGYPAGLSMGTQPASSVIPPPAPAGARGSVPGQPGLPLGVPVAATAAEPTLPEPSAGAWPFPSTFPRTSGTGRLAGGAALWSDFVYDDHGPSSPLGLPTGSSSNTSNLAATQGVFSYPDGAAHGNGADIFRSAVAADSAASYWRVDWNTLVKPVVGAAAVPLAEWTIDTDDNPATGARAGTSWPALAGVTSPGIERALVVSSLGARLVDAAKPADSGVDVRAAGGAVTVDYDSRSFIVRVPKALLPISGTWRVRLGAGLADATGTSFADPAPSGSNAQVTSADRLFNVSYRRSSQEPPVVEDTKTVTLVALAKQALSAPVVGAYGFDGLTRSITGNFWNEDTQADALAGTFPTGLPAIAAPTVSDLRPPGDVADFSQQVNTSDLLRRHDTAESQPTGTSTRWYVSRLSLGQGSVANPTSAGTGDLRPNYLGRVQPYTVYVPTGLAADSRTPLTWLLHSLGVNHHQYDALDPMLVQQVCQNRQSICASTLGFGPDGWYFDEAEVDFWQVWHSMAATYALDPERTVIGGYSMGGWATYKLGLAHPDLFAGTLDLEGPNICGIRVVDGVDLPGDSSAPGRCGADGKSAPLLGNARWLPYDITQGAIDELVPAPATLQQVQRFDSLGYRYHFTFYPGEDHLVYATQDRFAAPVAALGKPVRTVDPGHVTYSWFPDLSRDDLGIGTTTAYWLSGLTARSSAPGAIAAVDATASSIPDPAITPVRTGPTLINDPTPATVTALDYRYGSRPAARPVISLTLTGVRTASIDAVRTRFTCGTVATTSDGPTTVTLRGLPLGTVVTSDSVTQRVPSSGTAAVPIGSGATTITVACATPADAAGGAPAGSGTNGSPSSGTNALPRSGSSATSAAELAHTGGTGWPLAAITLTAAAGLLLRGRRRHV